MIHALASTALMMIVVRMRFALVATIRVRCGSRDL